MIGLSSALNISVRSLLFNQTALATISHNLANVNNPNYSRQEVLPSAQFASGFGAGVSLDGIIRRVDRQTQSELVEQVANRSFAETINQFSGNIEVIFGGPNDNTGIRTILANTFNQFNNVASLPESSSQKLNAVNQLQFLADQLNSMSDRLLGLQQTIDSELGNQITVINRTLERIHTLNTQIAVSGQNTLGGRNTNDLEDARQEQISFLAEHLKIQTFIDEDNRVIINAEGGQQILSSGGYTQLERTPSASGYPGIGARSVNINGEPANFILPLNTASFTGGSVKALVDLRDVEIPDVLSQLNEFARVTINSFNQVHSRGVSVPPPSSLTSTPLTTPGVDLFSEIGLVPGSSFTLSVVNPSTGGPVNTTTVTLPAVGPFSTTDLVNTINTALGAAGFPATVSANFVAGSLVIEDTSGTTGVVLGNDPDDFLGKIVLNPLLTGTDATDISVRSDILAQPGLLATAQLRASDGGLSLNNNANAIALAQIGTTSFSFNAAGSITPQTDTISGYFATITANLAVTLQDNTRRLEFAQNLEIELQSRNASVSGVNADEELANLIIFQNSFQASSRVISVIDEMFEALLSIR